jgi:hypothetical protein
MAIKIQGSTIIDDSKNIQDNTGFFSDNTNSALRPKSSSGGSYLQRWTGSTWETILFAGNGGITCNRDVSVSSPYKYYGDGSSLTGINASNADTVDSFHASEGFFNNSWCSRIPVVASNGVLEIGKFIDFHNNCASNVDYTYRLDNYSSGNLGFSGSILVESDIIAKNRLRVQRNGIDIEIGAENSIDLRGGSYQYIDFGNSSNDWTGRIIQSGVDMQLRSKNNLELRPDNNIRVFGLDPTDAEVRVMRLNSNNVVKKVNIGSSRRYKSNIKNLTTESFDKIYNIVPVSFNYNEDCLECNDLTGQGNYLKMGVIAEDTAEFMPEVVQFGYFNDQYEGDEMNRVLKENPVKTPMSVNYESIFICAVGALQQLRQKVVDLEEEVQSLKASLQTP